MRLRHLVTTALKIHFWMFIFCHYRQIGVDFQTVSIQSVTNDLQWNGMDSMGEIKIFPAFALVPIAVNQT
jgi:hypothetical protein